VHLKSGLIREVASLEGDNLVIFYYLSASDVWPYKRETAVMSYLYSKGYFISNYL